MRVLLLDTAGPVVGVAAWHGDTLVGAASARLGQGADGWLMPEAARLLDTLGGLDRVGVTVGPGAFTGLRVGLAVALGLAFARRVPVVGISSLALRAATAPGRARVLALLDAKKGRVYAGVYDTRGPVPEFVEEEGDVAPDRAAATLRAAATGEGAVVYRAVFEAAGHEVLPGADRSPVDAGLALVRAGAPSSPEDVGPRYLREPDARPSPR